jgi:hypothetical protein
MARGTGLTGPLYNSNPEPLDSRTWFETLDQMRQEIPDNHRFKGQKFVIKNPPVEDSPGGEPREYWFIEDFVPRPPPLGGPIVPQPVLYQVSGEEVNLDEHNDDIKAHQILQDNVNKKLNNIAGDTIMASNKDDFPHKNFDGSPMTVNQYSDRQPNPWVGRLSDFEKVPEIFDYTENQLFDVSYLH